MIIAFSPHLDDAVLSAGAYLAELALRYERVEVHTLFAGHPDAEPSPAATTFHRLCQLKDDPVRHRQAEDHAASQTLGVTAHHHGFLDAIYRRSPVGGWLCHDARSVFGELPVEPELRRELTAAVARLLSAHQPALVLTCAAIGGHVDHRLTREAVEAAASRTRTRLLLWEDLPHVMRRPDETVHGRPKPHHPTSTAWDRKWAAIPCYRSQLPMLWRDGRDWRSELAAYAVNRGGGFRPAEMLWEPS